MIKLDTKEYYIKTFPVLDLPVHIINDYGEWLQKRLRQRMGTHVVTLNAEMAILARKKPTLAKIIKQAELVIPDGAGVIMYMGLRGLKHKRCPGIELAESLLKNIGRSDRSYKICFYGGKPGITKIAANSWKEKFPRLSISTQHGYLSSEAEREWLQTLNKEQPDLIFVGLGVPRQEFWITENKHLCPNSIWIGVGGSFDVWSGNTERAPLWLRNNNLEWTYRLYKEPWRWKRMLALPHFALLSLSKWN